MSYLTVNAVQCKSCRCQDFTEEYEGAPLTCTNCGLVGQVEKLPEVNDLVNGFLSFDVCKFKIDPELIKMAEEHAAEEKRKKQEQRENADISELMGMMKLGYKRPIRKQRRKYRSKPY